MQSSTKLEVFGQSIPLPQQILPICLLNLGTLKGSSDQCEYIQAVQTLDLSSPPESLTSSRAQCTEAGKISGVAVPGSGWEHCFLVNFQPSDSRAAAASSRPALVVRSGALDLLGPPPFTGCRGRPDCCAGLLLWWAAAHQEKGVARRTPSTTARQVEWSAPSPSPAYRRNRQ